MIIYCFKTYHLSKETCLDHSLDLYFTSHLSLVKPCEIVPGISDYDMVIVDLDIKPKYIIPKKRRKIYNDKLENCDSIKQKLEKTVQVIKG